MEKGTNVKAGYGIPLMSSVFSYAGSEWSSSCFVVKEDEALNQGTKAIIEDGYFHVVTKQGKYYKAKFDNNSEGKLLSEQTETLIDWTHLNQ